jgi:hypothetical protein
MAGQVASNPLSTAPNLNASSTDPVALFTKSIVEYKGNVAPKGIVDKDIGGDDAITAKGIKETPSILSRLLAIPTTVLPSEADTNGVLNIIGDAATVLIPLFWNLNMVLHVSALRLTFKFLCVYLQDCRLVCQFAMDH